MNRTRAKTIGRAVLAAGVLAFLFTVRGMLPPFLVAVVAAYLLDPPVTYLERRWRVPRVWSILGIYAVLLGLLAASLFFLVPVFVQELGRLAESIPDYIAMLRGMIDAVQWGYRGARLPDTLKAALDETIARAEAGLLQAVRRVLEAVISGFPGLISMLISPVLAFYMLRDARRIKWGTLVAAVSDPAMPSSDWVKLAGEVSSVVAGFVRGQLLVALFVFITVSVILDMMGVRFALVLGIIAGLGEFIPYFGPFLAAIPAVVVALGRSPVLAVQVAVIFAVIQQVDATIIAPKIIGEHVGLHPLAVIFAVLSGGYLLGVWGMFLAIPVAGILKALLSFVYRKYLK
ncbi:MAG: AI-2E family transporter [Firmicutes bacterium]|nr:AI-2E family transporter [Bacillota bacterium]